MSEKITQAELARRLGVSRAAVSKAAKAGRIMPDSEGLFESAKAIDEWRSNTRASIKGPSVQAPARSRGGQPKYASARARKELHLANIAAIREARERGMLCEVESVKRAGRELGVLLRERLETIPDRVAPELLGQDIEAITGILRNSMDGVLTEIADRTSKLAAETVVAPSQGNDAG